VPGAGDDLQLRAADAAPHQLGIGARRDHVFVTNHDQRRHVDGLQRRH
jgi:hypothetical protein